MKSGGYFTFHSAKIVGGQNKMKSFKTEEEIQTIRIPAKKKRSGCVSKKNNFVSDTSLRKQPKDVWNITVRTCRDVLVGE